MTKYPLNLNPGASVVIEGRGSFLYFDSATAGGMDTSIKVVMPGANGGELILQVGQGFKLNQDYDRLVVSNNLSQGTIVGSLVIADGSFFDHRVVGTVSVIDGGKARTMSGVTFIGATGAPALAANNSHAQLWNPPSSTKNLIVEKITLSVKENASQVDFGTTFQAMTTQDASAQSKKLGAVASQSQMRWQQNAGGLLAGGVLGSAFLQAGSTIVLPFNEPIVITPAYGLAVEALVVNTTLKATFEFYEDPI